MKKQKPLDIINERIQNCNEKLEEKRSNRDVFDKYSVMATEYWLEFNTALKETIEKRRPQRRWKI